MLQNFDKECVSIFKLMTAGIGQQEQQGLNTFVFFFLQSYNIIRYYPDVIIRKRIFTVTQKYLSFNRLF